LEYVPTEHFTQSDIAVAPLTYLPIGQATHALSVLDPEKIEYLPGTQLVHVLAATTLEYLPIPHVMQTVAADIFE
jgi:hypothetical protein